VLSVAVRSVDDVIVHHLNVLKRDGPNFTCEIEFEARLTLGLEVRTERRYRHDYDAYEPSRVYSIERYIGRVFVAEVVVNFNPKAQEDIALGSVSVAQETVEIDINDLDL
jgi:hypothetical protein